MACSIHNPLLKRIQAMLQKVRLVQTPKSIGQQVLQQNNNKDLSLLGVCETSRGSSLRRSLGTKAPHFYHLRNLRDSGFLLSVTLVFASRGHFYYRRALFPTLLPLLELPTGVQGAAPFFAKQVAIDESMYDFEVHLLGTYDYSMNRPRLCQRLQMRC